MWHTFISTSRLSITFFTCKLLKCFVSEQIVIKSKQLGSLLKSIHYKRRAFSIFTSQKSNTFVEKIQNIIGMAGV